MNINFEILRMNPNNTNSVLVTAGTDAVIFDAWGGADDWKNLLTSRKLNPVAVYSTHGHFDHISAAPALARDLNIDWYLNHRDIEMVPACNDILQHFGLVPIASDYKKPIDLRGGQIEIIPGVNAIAIETPGHSGGGMAFYFPDENILIIGDTLFADTVGRYDLPGADLNELKKSISKIYDMNLSDDTMVIHGHGMNTTIGMLKHNNPYFKN